jgi:hypothetical protein
MIVSFIALAILRFFNLCVLLDSNKNYKEREMKKTKVTKIKQEVIKFIGLFISSVIETIWAIGVTVISGKLVI